MFKIYLAYFEKFGTVRKKKFLLNYFNIDDPGDEVSAEDILNVNGYSDEKFVKELMDKGEIYWLYL